MGEGDTHVHVEARWAVANKIPPLDIGPEQPSSRVGIRSGSHLVHVLSLPQPQAVTETGWPLGEVARRVAALARRLDAELAEVDLG
ncbi:hypothetical protein [Planomonospora parontospora]|uniref:hypothetical protein n=1 Tax=Planomonospora parontospora TaxID=58119 RepID=UPI00166FC604|nr:hypothetical protein [Planomonospora parontospora]